MRVARLVMAGLASAICAAPTSGAAGPQPADWVFQNGAVYTMETKSPNARAVAVTGKRIVYVGSDKGARAFVGKKTRVVDLKEQMLLPGFVDSHIHPTTAFIAEGADLQRDSAEEVLAAVKSWADANPAAKVVRGFGWRYYVFPPTGPDKAALDRLFPDRPVVLIAIDGHSAWVNSKALAIAGVDSRTPDPAPGFSWFQRDPATKELTGWLVEVPALQAVFFKLDPPTPEAVVTAMTDALPHFAAAGLTAAFDAGMPTMPTESGFEAYQRLEKAGKLPLRIVGSFYWNSPEVKDPVGTVLRLRERFHSELVKAKVLKINVDGGESQHTAALLEPYFDRPGFRGDYLLDPRLIRAAVLKAQANGVDTHAHAYGDAATRIYLDAIEAARKAFPKSLSRHTAGHALLLTDADAARFGTPGVAMSTSAQWIAPDPGIELMTKILGKELVFRELGRMNSVLKAGGRVALGTDWPAAGYVSTFQPLDAIQVAVTRAILRKYGKAEFMPVLPPENERITLDQALRAATLDSAWVLGLEKEVGSLRAGKKADLVVLEKNLHEIPPSEISTTKVKLTMMNGKITHRDGI